MIKTDKTFYKTYFTLCGTITLQSLIVFSVNLADSLMLGRYAETAMSGVSLANQIQFLLQMLVNGAGSGITVIAAQYWGKRETQPIRKIFAAALWIAMPLGILLGGLVSAFPTQVLGLLSDETEIVAQGAGYLRIMGWTYGIFILSNLLVSLMRSVESVRIGFAVSCVALVINVFLNAGLIFGRFGFPEMGVRGAAYATLISRIAELLTVIIYVLFIDKKLRMKAGDFFRCNKKYFRDYVRAGMPVILSGGSWGIAMTVQTAILGRLGAAAIGANAVVSPLFQVVSVLYSSSGSGSAVIIGKTVGEGDPERVKVYAKKLQVIFLLTGLAASAVLFLCGRPILSFYKISTETAELAKKFICILAVTVIGSSYEAPCLCGIVAGGGNTSFVLFNDIIFMWCLVLPMSYLSAFVFGWSVPVTFFLLKADQIAKCAVAVVKVNRFRWMRNLTESA